MDHHEEEEVMRLVIVVQPLERKKQFQSIDRDLLLFYCVSDFRSASSPRRMIVVGGGSKESKRMRIGGLLRRDLERSVF